MRDRSHIKTTVPVVAGLGSIALVLLTLGGYGLQVSTDLFITVILVVSFRFITTMGRWSFAHMALAGVGGYMSAILVLDHGVPFFLALLSGGAAAAGVALVLSVPTFRTNDFYFLMSTFAAAGLIAWTWNNYIHPFGGTSGRYGIPRPAPIGPVDFGSQRGYAFLALLIGALCLWVLLRLEYSRFGVVLKGIRWQAPVAQSVGINVRRYETVAFATGSFFAGVAGVLFVHYHGIAFPGSFGSPPMINLMMFVVIGGAERFWGPPLGAVVMILAERGIQQYPSLVPYTPLVFGLTTIAIVLVLPNGLIDLPSRLAARIRARGVRDEPLRRAST